MTNNTPDDDQYNYHDQYWRCGRADDCGLPAGWGTDHVGVGACKLHGGSGGGPSGPENGNWKHGLFSRHVSEEDKATMRRIEDMTTAAKLESTLNYELMKLDRAIAGMESEDRPAFLDVFKDVVRGAAGSDGEIDATQLQFLAQMLGENDRAIREWADLIRKTAKDLHKITDGESVSVDVGVDEEGLEEVRALVEGAYGSGEEE